MMTRRLKRAIAAGILAGWIGLPTVSVVQACGPYFREAVFVSVHHPSDREAFVNGRLGVLLPSFWRVHLLVAYRHLMGRPLSEEERLAMRDYWVHTGREAAPDQTSGLQRWLDARQAFSDPVPRVRAYRQEGYSFYLNCTDPAFETAAATLADRIGRFGRRSEAVSHWVNAQDRVFANCSESGPMPEPATPDLPPLIQHDREYQLAAALFYDRQYDRAEAQFARIASTSESPWKDIAALLIARVKIRRAWSGTENDEPDKAELLRARRQLEGILSDDNRAPVHRWAEDLKSYVDLRLEPARSLRALADRLASGERSDRFGQDVVDWAFLMDRRHPSDDPLTGWVRAFQSRTEGQPAARWESDPSPLNLLALAQRSTPESVRDGRVPGALARMSTENAGFLTAAFHRARLLIQHGRLDESREWIDQQLNREMSLSDRNLFLLLRLPIAKDLAEFTRLAALRPLGTRYDIQPLRPLLEQEAMLFTPQASRWLTERLPLDVLLKLALGNPWPTALQHEVAQMVWVRAVLLERWDVLERVTPRLIELSSGSRNLLRQVVGAPSPDQRRFEAAWTLLQRPGWHLYAGAGVLRERAEEQRDPLRHNWWCPEELLPGGRDHYRNGIIEPRQLSSWLAPETASPLFLETAQQREAENEWRQLMALGGPANVMASMVLHYQQGNPGDDRLPEALHRVVQATRYGCGDPRTTEFSRLAFQRLHRHYPASPWTKKTPYWY